MKKSNVIIYIVVAAVVGLLIGAGAMYLIKGTKKAELVVGVKTEEKVTVEPTDVSVIVTGFYDAYINKDFLKDLPVYHVNAVLEGDTTPVEVDFNGIRITDIFNKLKLDNNYSSVAFMSTDLKIKMNFQKKEITDSLYLVISEGDTVYAPATKIIDIKSHERYVISDISEFRFF